MADVQQLLANFKDSKSAALRQTTLMPGFGVGAYHAPRAPWARGWHPQAQYQAARAQQGAYVGNGQAMPAVAPPQPPQPQPHHLQQVPQAPQPPPPDPYYPDARMPPQCPPQYPIPQPHQQHPECDPTCGIGVTQHCETPQPCRVNAIGSTTFGTQGILPGQTVPLIVTAGDAQTYTPKRIFFEAAPWASPDLIDISDMPAGVSSLPVFLVDALVGRKSQLRRGGQPKVGLTQGAYSNSKEIELVDWQKFSSTQEQNLSLFFYNPNKDKPIHVSVVLWGDI